MPESGSTVNLLPVVDAHHHVWRRADQPWLQGPTVPRIFGTYESINLSAWTAGNPDLLLSTNFGVPESVFAKFPKDAVIMPD